MTANTAYALITTCLLYTSNNNYEIIGKPLSNLINTGKCIEQVEPLRDFNGYSWTTVSSEIESIEHNLIFQNLRLLLGNKFLNNWIENKEFIIDYMELLKNRLEEQYGCLLYTSRCV